MLSNQKTTVKSAPSVRHVELLKGALLALLAWWLCNDLGLLWLLPPLRGFDYDALFAIALGAWLGAKRRETVLLGVASVVAIFWLSVCFTPLASRMAWPLKTQATPQEIARGADAVYVLASNVQPDGDFTHHALSRLLPGVELVRQKRARVLVLAEIRPPAGSYIKATQRLCEDLKIEVPLVRLPGTMRDTHDEAVAFAKLAQSRGWKRAFIVTSPTHTRRSSLVFRHAARGADVEIFPLASAELDFDFEALDSPGDRIRAFAKALHENVGLWVYKRRGWIA
jgi:uncharacterized SAM-binding protein YcdF (DUF218 family)